MRTSLVFWSVWVLAALVVMPAKFGHPGLAQMGLVYAAFLAGLWALRCRPGSGMEVRGLENGRLFWLDLVLRAVLSVLVLGTVAYLLATGTDVPDWLVVLSNLILGFWFGASTLRHVNHHRASSRPSRNVWKMGENGKWKRVE